MFLVSLNFINSTSLLSVFVFLALDFSQKWNFAILLNFNTYLNYTVLMFARLDGILRKVHLYMITHAKEEVSLICKFLCTTYRTIDDNLRDYAQENHQERRYVLICATDGI